MSQSDQVVQDYLNEVLDDTENQKADSAQVEETQQEMIDRHLT